jgi:hypothetical protein
MFQAIEAAKPGFLAFPARGNSVVWFQSTVLLTVLGAFMWPHLFCAAYTAKDERSFRRNSIVLPLYSLLLLFVCFVGFCAILQVPGLQGADIDLALLKRHWRCGIDDGAGIWIGSAHLGSDDPGERYLSRRHPAGRFGCQRHYHGAHHGAGGHAGRGRFRPGGWVDHRGAAADGI